MKESSTEGSSSNKKRTTSPSEKSNDHNPEDLVKWKVSKFRELQNDKEKIKSLDIEQCACFVASSIYFLDDKLADEFRILQPLLSDIFMTRFYNGMVQSELQPYGYELNESTSDIVTIGSQIVPCHKPMSLRSTKPRSRFTLSRVRWAS